MDSTAEASGRPTLLERAAARKDRHSIVEKAAEKLGSLVDASITSTSQPDAARETSASPGGGAPSADAPPPGSAGARPGPQPDATGQAFVAEPARTAQDPRTPANGPQTSATGSGQTPPVPRAKSRHATIDFERLASKGVITPDSLRTKTTEEFRLLKRTVLSKRWQSDMPNANLIMVTSALPSEGKTFVSINLAISIACERDLRVLLIDADLSRPSIPGILGLDVDRGLVDVLTDDSVDFSDVLLKTDIDGLTILPSGRQHHLSTELLASQSMAAFAENVAQRYADRIVIFDTPPVLATSEPSALAQHVGQIMFVVRAEHTSGAAVRAAMEIIGDNPNIGFVLNQSKPRFGSATFGYYYYKGYYYHQY